MSLESSSGTGGGAGKDITFNIDKLVGEIHIHAASVKESAAEIKRVVVETLLTAGNDAQSAM